VSKTSVNSVTAQAADHQPRGLDSQTVVVTGGAKGIGAAISRRIAAAGANVTIVDLDEPAATALAAELPNAEALAVDITDYAALTEAFADVQRRRGPVHVLVNNAGWDHVKPFTETEPALWDRLIDINLRGLLNATHLALAQMVPMREGCIVNIASDAGRVGSSGEAVYSACKGGTIAFTKSIARETARHGISVNCVCPGPTDTPLLGLITGDQAGTKIIDAMVRATPDRRIAQPEDIAEAVAFFAARPIHITGQVISVSGGLTMAG
jgi:2-hydroxycyclohexanecarboxyl-CoA dehydrogenase